MKTPRFLLLIVALLPAVVCPAALGQGTAFTYQGNLNSGASPANGVYDFQFALFDDATDGTQISGLITNASTTVSNGLFTVAMDFGSVFTGATRWMEIAVRTNGATSFITLSPRQSISPTPYAIFAGGANAAGLSGTISSTNIANGTITSNLLAPGSIGTNQLDNTVGVWSRNGGNISYNAGLVGIGTVNPTATLNVSGTFLGGRFNSLAANLTESAIVGGSGNDIQINADGSFIGGGIYNGIRTASPYSAIVVGFNNFIQDGASQSFIGGGGGNVVGTNSFLSFIGGGINNIIQPQSSQQVIAGGMNNTIQSFSWASTIGGGGWNIAQGYGATVPGGWSNSATANFAFAGGLQAQALHQGAFVWADSQSIPFSSTAANQFLIRAQGGVGIGTGSPQSQLHVASTDDRVALMDSTSVIGTWLDLRNTASGTNWDLISTGSANSEGPGKLLFAAGPAPGVVSAEVMTLSPLGKVGIGTVNPQATLEVRGLAGTNNSQIAGAIQGVQTAGGVFGGGVYGLSLVPGGSGVIGQADVPGIGGSFPAGVSAYTAATNGTGLYAYASATTGPSYGVYAQDGSSLGYAGYFIGRGYFSGNVGISSSSPSARLSITGGNGNDQGIRLQNTGVSGGHFWNIHIDANGDALVFSHDNQWPSVNYSYLSPDSAGLITTSDSRAKKDIDAIPSCLDRVMALTPSTFRYRQADENSPLNYGFIAQDVEKQFPDLVQERNGLKTLVGAGLTAINTKAIQDLNQKTDDRIQKLEIENTDLKERLAALEKLVFKQREN